MLDPMKEIGSIHTFEDKAFLRWIARVAAAVLVSGVVVGVVWYGVASLVLPGRTPFEVLGLWYREGLGGLAVWTASLLGVNLAALPLHEVVHAVFFKLFAPAGSSVRFGANWKAGMIYACAEGIVYTRRQYMVIAAAPSIAVTVAIAAVAVALGWPLWGLIGVTVHLSGCTGDWGYLRAIHADAAISHCEDTAWGVLFFGTDQGDGDDR